MCRRTASPAPSSSPTARCTTRPRRTSCSLKAPLQVLIAGKHDERDRKLTVDQCGALHHCRPRRRRSNCEVDDFGSTDEQPMPMSMCASTARISGDRAGAGGHEDARSRVPITHGGENVIELIAGPDRHELTLENNRAVVAVNGVRDRLRVLLVSGEPHAGERVWRTLLKADPRVDLVHFTILRPPDKQDRTPIDELSLIAFPDARIVRRKARPVRPGHLRPLSRAGHPAARLFREHRPLCRRRRRAAGVGGARIRAAAKHLSHAAGRGSAGPAERRGGDAEIPAAGHRDRQGAIR